MDRVITEYIAEGGKLSGIFLGHRAGMVDMLLTEFDEEAFVRDILEEGHRQGVEEIAKEVKRENPSKG